MRFLKPVVPVLHWLTNSGVFVFSTQIDSAKVSPNELSIVNNNNNTGVVSLFCYTLQCTDALRISISDNNIINSLQFYLGSSLRCVVYGCHHFYRHRSDV